MVQKYYVLLRYTDTVKGVWFTDELKIWAKDPGRVIELAEKKWQRHFWYSDLSLISTAVSTNSFLN